MRSIFEDHTCKELLERLEALKEDAVPQWGTMNVGQMLAHCQAPLEVGLGHSTLTRVSFIKRWIFGLFKASLYNDKPWKKNLRTAPEYKITDKRDFLVEKSKLKLLIEEFHAAKHRKNWPVHPYFGEFTPEQWGKLEYKHLDHHFRQFNV